MAKSLKRRGNAKSKSSPARERRTGMFPFRMSKRERADLDKLSATAGLSKAAFLRSRMYLKAGAIVKDVAPVPKSDQELKNDEYIRQLSAIGNNINQITRGVNATGLLNKPGRLDRALDDLAALMLQIGNTIR